MFLLVTAALAEETCSPPSPPPERLQVAWVSPERARAGLHTTLVVVPARALLALAEEAGGDAERVLTSLGVSRTGGEWKVTLFDVDRAELCWPIAGEGAEAGLNRCDTARRPGWVRRRAWSGCGWIGDADTGARTLDVYGVEWADAADQGFCVLPLSRFLAGPPR